MEQIKKITNALAGLWYKLTVFCFQLGLRIIISRKGFLALPLFSALFCIRPPSPLFPIRHVAKEIRSFSPARSHGKRHIPARFVLMRGDRAVSFGPDPALTNGAAQILVLNPRIRWQFYTSPLVKNRTLKVQFLYESRFRAYHRCHYPKLNDLLQDPVPPLFLMYMWIVSCRQTSLVAHLFWCFLRKKITGAKWKDFSPCSFWLLLAQRVKIYPNTSQQWCGHSIV